jgi:hypothetical protein
VTHLNEALQLTLFAVGILITSSLDDAFIDLLAMAAVFVANWQLWEVAQFEPSSKATRILGRIS